MLASYIFVLFFASSENYLTILDKIRKVISIISYDVSNLIFSHNIHLVLGLSKRKFLFINSLQKFGNAIRDDDVLVS